MKTVLELQKAKASGQQISMVTCYDYTSAAIVNSSKVDCILVGDSLAMTMLGREDTLAATAEIMALHVASVRRGAPDKLIVADMPFLAHRGSLDRTIEAVRLLVQAGAQAVKIEGIDGSGETIRHLVQSGVPVMAHLGLTPQSVHQFGGYKVQATERRAAEILSAQAFSVQDCGAFALVLECVPAQVAKNLTAELQIPTIGIGAGVGCNGQVLVMQDLLGLNEKFKPKFVRSFLSGAELFREAFDRFDESVKSGTFPAEKESY